jgi:hypothetical protein
MASQPELPRIRVNRPLGQPPVTPEFLQSITLSHAAEHQTLGLFPYLQRKVTERKALGKEADPIQIRENLNPHRETFIVASVDGVTEVSREALQASITAGDKPQIVGISRWANDGNNQVVEARVHGVSPVREEQIGEGAVTGFERPTVIEGPHMDVALYGFDANNVLHVIRTVQLRQGKAVIDTVRGFATAEERENGIQMYDLDQAQDAIVANITKLLGEEAGQLQVEQMIYLGTTIPNTTFTDSQTAFFAVQVNYEAFIKAQKSVLSLQEAVRRQEAFEHEGIVSHFIDMTVDQYMELMRNSGIPMDATANYGTSFVVMDEMMQQREKLAQENTRLTAALRQERRRIMPRLASRDALQS